MREPFQSRSLSFAEQFPFALLAALSWRPFFVAFSGSQSASNDAVFAAEFVQLASCELAFVAVESSRPVISASAGIAFAPTASVGIVSASAAESVIVAFAVIVASAVGSSGLLDCIVVYSTESG